MPRVNIEGTPLSEVGMTAFSLGSRRLHLAIAAVLLVPELASSQAAAPTQAWTLQTDQPAVSSEQ